MERVLYRLQIVGGPFDGAPGMACLTEPDFPLPDRILLGRCPGDGACEQPACQRSREHVSYWIEGDDDIPTRTVEYELRSESVSGEPVAVDIPHILAGEAVYAIGGLPSSLFAADVALVLAGG